MSAFPHLHRSRQSVFDHPFFTEPLLDPFVSHRFTSPVFDVLRPGHVQGPPQAVYFCLSATTQAGVCRMVPMSCFEGMRHSSSAGVCA